MMTIVILSFLALLSLLLISRQRKGITAFFSGKRHEPTDHSAGAREDIESLFSGPARPAVADYTRATGPVANKDILSFELDEKLLFDGQGNYLLLKKTIEKPRKTYLSGYLRGKYWGGNGSGPGKGL